MKVLLMIDSLDSGGAERQMSYLAIGLHRAGVDVCLAMFSDGKHNFYLPQVDSAGVPYKIYTNGVNKFRRIFEIAKVIKAEKPDISVVYKDGVCIGACLAKLLIPFKLIVSERNTTQELTRYEKLKFFIYKLANRIVPNSYSQRKFIIQNFPNLGSKVRVITNTLQTSIFFPPKEKDKPCGKLKVVTTARVMEQKNVLSYLSAVNELRRRGVDAEFHWYGFQGSDYFKTVLEYSKKLGLEEIVKFHEPEKDIAKVYREADIFCLPSIYEGFPNVVCEAMACGLPVVCSNVCDNPAIVEEGKNGFLFDPNDTVSMADSIEKMILLPIDVRAEIGNRNVEKIRNLCSEEAFIRKYIDLFEELI